MYSQADLDEAVAAGALSAEAAAAFRVHIERQRSAPAVDEEHFRLITGFNDIFVAIAAAILLFAIAWLGQRAGIAAGLAIEAGEGPSFLAPAAVAAVSWALALFFTARRRMALPSILLLLTFVGGIFLTAGFALVLAIGPDQLEGNNQLGGVLASLSGAIAAAAAWLHWKRFKVPITVAAGAASVAAIAIGLLVAALGGIENMRNIVLGFVLMLGVGTFLFAMWWDGSDRARVTRRSDVAFWLHLLAAPMIVHPVFTLLGLNDGNATIAEGIVVILLYVAIGVTALAIDRRALLVSALAYVLWALSNLFERFGAVELNLALTALVIGSSLLLLSAFWQQARELIVGPLPDSVKERLPIVNRLPAAAQPAA